MSSGSWNGISPVWGKVIRALEASAKYNNGFAVVELKIVVSGNTPVLWLEPTCKNVSPAKVASVQMTPAIASCLTALLD